MSWSDLSADEWAVVAFVVILLAAVKGPSILRALRWLKEKPGPPPPGWKPPEQ